MTNFILASKYYISFSPIRVKDILFIDDRLKKVTNTLCIKLFSESHRHCNGRTPCRSLLIKTGRFYSFFLSPLLLSIVSSFLYKKRLLLKNSEKIFFDVKNIHLMYLFLAVVAAEVKKQ